MRSHLLSEINPHSRDKYISFVDEGHIYTLTLNGVEIHPDSTTQTIGKYYEHFDDDKVVNRMFIKGEDNLNPKYKSMKKEGMTTVEFKQFIKDTWKKNGEDASKAGTAMHKDIESYFNGEHIENPNSKEFKMFLEFWGKYQEDHPGCRPYRSEWLVWDSENGKNALSGSIDFVVIHSDNTLSIIDWKRVLEIKKENSYVNKYDDVVHKKMLKPFNAFDDCNLNHYLLQLNFYLHILETLYDKKVRDMSLVKLHPDQENYMIYQVDRYDLSKIWHTLR